MPDSRQVRVRANRGASPTCRRLFAGRAQARRERVADVVPEQRLEQSRGLGERTNGRLLNAVGWVTTFIMGVAAIALVVTSILG